MAKPALTTGLVERAALLFCMQPGFITGASRKPRMVAARSAVALAARQAGRSYPQIGAQLGGRHHTTIMNAVRLAKERCTYDPRYKAKCDVLARLALGDAEGVANDD